jgi:signal transduction histidine kinase/uncharacterized protein YigA (DUF484 family)
MSTNPLGEQLKQREAELAVINSIQQALVAEMDLPDIYNLVGDRLRELFDAQVTIIAVFDHEKFMEEFKYFFENGERFKPEPRVYNAIRKQLIDQKKLILINNNVKLYIEKAVPGTAFPKSMIFVPLITKDTVLGYVSLQNIDIEFAFSESDVRLLSTLANSMSVALENARLFNETTRLLAETEQRNAELAIINSVQDGLVREMDMAAIYKLVGEKICDVLNTQTMIIRTFDHESGLEHWQYAIEKGERIDVEPRPFIWANKILIETKKHLVINKDYQKIALENDGSSVTKGLAPKSAIFVPMLVGDTVIGSVSLQNVESEHAFSESDLQLITTLTNSMSVALENARLFSQTACLLEETEQRATELHTVNNISKALVSELEFDSLIKLVGEQMRETFKADIVYLAIHDPKTNMLYFPYYYGDVISSRPFGNGITENIILSKNPLLVNHDFLKTIDKIQAEKKGQMVESYLGVPIMVGKTAIGVISVQSKEQENRFTESDQRLLTTIAANVGIAMQNAESYDKLRSALSDLKAAQEQLVQQEKLASLGQLTAGIAHEIKNPLNFVTNFSDLSLELLDELREDLRQGGDWSDDANAALLLVDIEQNLRKIYEHGTRADSIVKSMLQHSRGGSGVMEPANINAVIKEFVNLAFHGMRASKQPINVDIDLDLDETIGDVPLITEDFSRVILNVCNNAFDAMREKSVGFSNVEGGRTTSATAAGATSATTSASAGTSTSASAGTATATPTASASAGTSTSASAGKYQPKLTVRTRLVESGVQIVIEDNGPGIPSAIKDQILQPFFTTKKGTQGTGLGLSITHDIIKSHGGVLDIQSEPGHTAFTITLRR